MDYKTYSPDASIDPFVKCFWSLEAPATVLPEKQRIVPDGCMEMIFHYGDLYRQYTTDGTSIIQPRCFVFGQITTPLEIAPTGTTGILAARFHPDGFIPFTDYPLAQMENKAVALAELFGVQGLELENNILGLKTTDERIDAITAFLSAQLSTSLAIERITRSSIELLLQVNGQLSVDELASQLKVNRRKLERRFSDTIGMSPKQLAKIIRLQSALKMIGQQPAVSLTSLAYENGYFDQAHFIKDFKEFTGQSPRQFYAANLKMSALFASTE